MSEEEKISPEEFPQEQPACTAGEIQETINQLQTENMEVHHHPNVEKKNVKEYFLEFLMIFLAVTMGFFAEQIREHYIEIKREKHSMISLVKDLESDTMQLSNIKIYHKAKLAKIDSLLIFFAENTDAKIPLHQYRFMQQLFGHLAFFQNSGTLDQLNNSGDLRLIQKRNVVDSIEVYSQQIKRMSLRDLYLTDFMFENNKLAQKVFEGKTALRILVDTAILKKVAEPNLTIPENKQYLDEYLNSLLTFRIFEIQIMRLHDSLKNRVEKLLALIKKEYSLE